MQMVVKSHVAAVDARRRKLWAIAKMTLMMTILMMTYDQTFKCKPINAQPSKSTANGICERMHFSVGQLLCAQLEKWRSDYRRGNNWIPKSNLQLIMLIPTLNISFIGVNSKRTLYLSNNSILQAVLDYKVRRNNNESWWLDASIMTVLIKTMRLCYHPHLYDCARSFACDICQRVNSGTLIARSELSTVTDRSAATRNKAFYHNMIFNLPNCPNCESTQIFPRDASQGCAFSQHFIRQQQQPHIRRYRLMGAKAIQRNFFAHICLHVFI